MEIAHELLQEQLPHGNAMFPLMIHEFETDCRCEERVNCHWHDEIEILTVTEGEAQIHIDGRSYFVKQGDMVFIRSNHLHSVTGKQGVRFAFFAVVFSQAFLNSYVNDIIQQQYIDRVKDEKTVFPEIITQQEEWGREIFGQLSAIREAFGRKKAGYELLIRARLYDIWYFLINHAEAPESEQKGRPDYQAALIRSVLAYIREHYEERITLSELSGAFHISEGHLCRVFRSITRMSVIEYINYYRVGVSAGLLADREREIGEIAGMAGFSNISYFNKLFRKYMHMTPSEFRRSMGERDSS